MNRTTIESLRTMRMAHQITEFQLSDIAKRRIKLVLSPFIIDYQSFVEFLDNNSSIISGFTALAFFIGPAIFTPTALDICVPVGTVEQARKYLEAAEAYTVSIILMTVQTLINCRCALQKSSMASTQEWL